MRVNTTTSMQLARRIKGKFGTWQAVREAARLEDGVYVLPGRAEDNEPFLAQPQRRPVRS